MVIAFDTLKLARRLEAAGFGREQAMGAAEALAEVIGEAIVTRDYLDHRLGETDARIAALEANLRAEIATLDTNLRAEIATLDTNLRAEIATREAGLRTHLADVRTELLKWMIGLLLGQTAIIAALVRLL
jgi:hypothetical protein